MSVATPGDYLSVIEEFTPGSGVYEEGGGVYASIVGTVVKDLKERRISIQPSSKRSSLLPRKGDLVLGVVLSVRRDLAEVDIHEAEGLKSFKVPFKGVIHISEVDVKFIDKVASVLWPGDVVKARVVAVKDPYSLTIKERRLGVVLALCSKCRYPLLLKTRRLTCPSCGSEEQRKFSSDYLLRWGRMEARLIKALAHL